MMSPENISLRDTFGRVSTHIKFFKSLLSAILYPISSTCGLVVVVCSPGNFHE